MKLFAIINEKNSHIRAVLIREKLLDTAGEKGIAAEIHIQGETAPVMTPPAKNADDVLLLLDVEKPDDFNSGSFAGIIIAPSKEIFRDSDGLWAKIEAVNTGAEMRPGKQNAQKIIAVTSCPTGIAHTFMAAAALEEGAKKLGVEIRIETQGSIGAQKPLTEQEIEGADLVIIAADREVDKSRFDGKNIYISGTKPAIANGAAYIEEAFKKAHVQNSAGIVTDRGNPARTPQKRTGFSAPLMNGISFMLPFIVAGGLLMALGLALGGINVEAAEGSFANIIYKIGAQNVFPLIMPVLAGYIGFAIADRPALAPGMVGGFIAGQTGSGFIGAIIAGFLAGYAVKLSAACIKLPNSINGLKPVLILPLFCVAIVGLIMIYIVQGPATALLNFLTDFVGGLEQNNGSALLIGALLGGMMAIDMGGPVNKAAYTVGIGLLSVKIYTPMAAIMIGGMTPPIALALSCYIRPGCFTRAERAAKEACFIMGLSFISEAAIPFAARNPVRIIPCLVTGSAVAGLLAMAAGAGIIVPHGGIFLLPIKGAIINYGGYFAALIGGILISALCLCSVLQRAPEESEK